MNKDRTTLRRKPQKIQSINPEFDENDFNFNKINPKEILSELFIGEVLVTFMINVSPLTNNHLLVCPSRTHKHPQKINEECLEVAIELMKNIKDK